jgi:rfaE bifunctional protein nucleotidyltransferase chain/domain
MAMDSIQQSFHLQMTGNVILDKIITIDQIEKVASSARHEGKRLVHAHGVFDLLHIGHIRHLSQARELGDLLVVSITQDLHVNKGPNRPAFSENLRAEALASLEFVDYVVVSQWATSVEIINRIKPYIYVKGTEFKELKDITGAVRSEAEAVRQAGGEIRFVGDIVFSSSSLINTHLSELSPEQQKYFEAIRKKYTCDQVLDYLEVSKDQEVMLIGETIVDEYVYSLPLGKSSKDPILAVLTEEVETCPGGVAAIANHLAGFCRRVHLITQLGSECRKEEFLRAVLKPEVESHFLTRQGAPTICKRRFIDRYSGNKMFEVYEMDQRDNRKEEQESLENIIGKTSAKSDVDMAVVADYGHGMINKNAAGVIRAHYSFLSVNTQCNAGNGGLNSIVAKYMRPDYICFAENELCMEMRHVEGDSDYRLEKLAQKMECSRCMLTRGKFGTLYYSADGSDFHKAPSLTNNVVDRVGAGDSVLAITSLLTKHDVPIDIISLIANAAGAIQVGTLGNRQTLDKLTLSRFLISLLK